MSTHIGQSAGPRPLRWPRDSADNGPGPGDIVVVTGLLAREGWWALTGHWQLYAFGASGLIAAVLAQDAFAGGSFPAALTAMTVADPLAAWVWGAILFDERPPTSLPAPAGLNPPACRS
ncbi:MAG: hypothetical protein HOV79_04590 [Hamadaea sp.]|nr:hypothetical protein [Hamadaea sp.]